MNIFNKIAKFFSDSYAWIKGNWNGLQLYIEMGGMDGCSAVVRTGNTYDIYYGHTLYLNVTETGVGLISKFHTDRRSIHKGGLVYNIVRTEYASWKVKIERKHIPKVKFRKLNEYSQ